jgi:hypothetical protein
MEITEWQRDAVLTKNVRVSGRQISEKETEWEELQAHIACVHGN